MADNLCVILITSVYANMSCLVLREGQRFKEEGCQNTGAMHPWYSGAPGNKFVLASVVKEPVRQTIKVCRTANIDAMFGQTSFIWSVGVHCFGHFQIHVSWTG